ncbi:MAG: hypothetical protein R3F11_17725 [Verrucomicrobiales bacterium]
MQRADACLIMDDDNPARLYSCPAKASTTTAASGAVDGNSRFRTIVDLGGRPRQAARPRPRAGRNSAVFSTTYKAPIVFEGNAPPRSPENTTLAKALVEPARRRRSRRSKMPGSARRKSIKGPTEAAFQRQTAAAMLIVPSTRDESALAMFGLARLTRRPVSAGRRALLCLRRLAAGHARAGLAPVD